jgi:hypothetical protein
MASSSEDARQIIDECEKQLNSFDRSQPSVSTEEARLRFQIENAEFYRRHSLLTSEITNHASSLLNFVDGSYNQLYRSYYETMHQKNIALEEENKKLKARLETISRAISE